MRLQLIHKQSEGSDIVSFAFRPERPLEWQAGQYMRWSIEVAGQSQDHWFTIAAPPHTLQPTITTRIRQESGYKQALAALAVGDNIDAAAVSGDFVWAENDQPLIFIAGGIGVTPFYAMLLDRAYRDLPLAAHLVHVHQSTDTLFASTFDELSRNYSEFTITHIIDQALTSKHLQEIVNNLNSRSVYISGPELMVDTTTALLRQHGIEDHHLKRDRFQGYADTSS